MPRGQEFHKIIMKKIKIGINTLPLFDTMAGAERYTQNIIKSLAKLDKRNDYVLFLNKYNEKFYKIEQDNFKNIICVFPKNKIARAAYEQFVLPKKARRENIDILFSTCNIAPLSLRCRLVTMMFDLHWLRIPRFFSGMKNFYIKKMLEATAKRSDKILTLSLSSKNDIAEIFNINPEKIKVTYCGSENMPFPAGAAKPRPGGVKYILFVGQFHKRKNIPTLIKAFEKVKDKLNTPHQLYLAGRRGDGYEEVTRLCEKSTHKDDIKIAGYILDEELALLYNNADMFIYPSFYEGFGMPVIEAMAYNLPVICSNSSSLPEVAADAALYFDPGNPDELAAKIEILIKDGVKKEELIKKGREQIKKFTWEEVGRRTLEAIEEIGLRLG